MNRRNQIRRIGVLCSMMVLIAGLMVLRLVDLQIVNGAAYRQEAERKILLKNLTGSSAFKNGGVGHEVSE